MRMPVVEHISAPPEDALAARRSLRAQIARLDRELATILASSYPPIAPTGAREDFGGPRLLGLAELERIRDALAARLSAADRAVAEQTGRQAQARALLQAMLADPPGYKGARVSNADLGRPGCTTYQVLPRLGPLGLLTGWWRVKISSGCPLPSAAT